MQINQTTYDYTSTSVKLSVQTGAASQNAAVKDAGEAKETTDTYLPSAKYAPDMGLVEQMKSSLQTSQQKLFDLVNDILSRQGMSVTQGQGVWRTLSGGEFQVDAETQAAAKEAISEDGDWGVKKTSQRIVDFAKALTGGDKSKIDMMKDAFIKGYEAAAKLWGRELPDICKDTYDAVMKLFDEWENGGGEKTEAAEAPARNAPAAGTTITFEYERTEISSSSFSFTSGDRDAAQLEKSGVLSDVSAPLKFDGMTLRSSWCMNERISVTITVGGSQSQSVQQPQASAGQDGFVPSAKPEDTTGAYGPNGKKVGWNNGNAYGHHKHGRGLDADAARQDLKNIQLAFFKPLQLNSGKDRGSFQVGGQEIPLHEDGTVTVGLSDGTLRRAKVNQGILNQMLNQTEGSARNNSAKVDNGNGKGNNGNHYGQIKNGK